MMNSELLGLVPHPTFYMVLKGEVLIFHDPGAKCLRLLAPHVPGHVYTAGPWLSPLRIPKGQRLKLHNVKSGKATPGDCKDFLIRLPNARPRLDLSWFEIEVPLPRVILAGGVQETSNVHITIGGHPFPHTPKFTCLAAILVYDWSGEDSSVPVLSDLDSKRIWKCGGKLLGFRSLHVCASGERGEEEGDTEHARQAFIKAAEVLGVTADIVFNGGAHFTPTIPPPGLAYLEANGTYFETLQLGQALGEILQGGQGEIPDIQPKSFLDGNCGPVGNS